MQNIFPDLSDEVAKKYRSGDQPIISACTACGSAWDGPAFELALCTIIAEDENPIILDFTSCGYFENPL